MSAVRLTCLRAADLDSEAQPSTGGALLSRYSPTEKMEDPPGHHAGVKLARVTAWRSPADLLNSRGRKGPVLDGPLT
jgi:hypothetical protein